MKRLLLPLLAFASTLSSVSAQPTVVVGPEVAVTQSFTRRMIAENADQKAPAFAAAGRNGDFLLAWTEYDVTTLRVALVTAKIDANGAIVPGTRNVAPAQRLTDGDAMYPAVGFDGERFLVVWNEGFTLAPRLLGMRFDRDGKPLDPVPFSISIVPLQTWNSVTVMNGEFLVTYGMTPLNSRGTGIARIATDGTVRERDVRVQGTTGHWRDVESNGSSFFIAAEFSTGRPACIIEFCSGASFRSLTNVARNTPAPSNVPLLQTTNAPVPIGTGVATDGTRYLVVSWARNNAPTQTGAYLRGSLTDPAGASFVREFVVAKNPAETISDLQSGRIDVAWTGSVYAAAYEEIGPVVSNNVDLRLALISPTGMSLVDPVVVGSSPTHQERMPVVLPVSENRLLVLYERAIESQISLAARTVGIAIKTRAIR